MSDAQKLPPSAHVRLAVAVVAGLLVGAAALAAHLGALAVLVALTTTHLVFVVLGWRLLWPLTAQMTRRTAQREDVDPHLEEVLVLVVSLGALVGIAVVLLTGGAGRQVAAVVALLGVFLAWGSLHLMYAARYAFLYYDEHEGPGVRARSGGIDWNADGYEPTYRDFLYFSYNLGMTYQVSDTSVSDPRIRAVTLRHCLLSYVFGAVILASTINLVSGIATSGS